MGNLKLRHLFLVMIFLFGILNLPYTLYDYSVAGIEGVPISTGWGLFTLYATVSLIVLVILLRAQTHARLEAIYIKIFRNTSVAAFVSTILIIIPVVGFNGLRPVGEFGLFSLYLIFSFYAILSAVAFARMDQQQLEQL